MADWSKFTLSLLTILLATALLFVPIGQPALTGSNWVTVATWVVSAYILGQAAAAAATGWLVQSKDSTK